MKYQADISQVKDFLYRIIHQQADNKAQSWLEQQKENFNKELSNRHFYLAFSTASRFFSKEAVRLSETEQQAADQLRKGFQPAHWHLLQAARTYLLLQLPHDDAEQYLKTLDRLLETADMDEQVALYAALPLLPYPESLTKRASEGLRTNMTLVFDAIVLHNPYPADFLTEKAWNQMLLKAVFMQRPLYKIYHAEDRANLPLARMLIDFAHERWAAHRKVTPELWRFIGPFLNEDFINDIEKVVKQGEPFEVEAGLLACWASNDAGAKQMLEGHPEVKQKIERGQLTWQYVGESSAAQ